MPLEPWTGQHDAVVIGGGFYGAAIAIHLKRRFGFEDVMLLERGDGLLGRSSYTNQARVHNGYHYPRSFTTAYRSRVNFPRFLSDWPDAVYRAFTKLYAVPCANSKVSGQQFERFSKEIGAPIERAGPSLQRLFDPLLIEDVFLVQEYAFDSTKLASWAARELGHSGVRLLLNCEATAITAGADGLQVMFNNKPGQQQAVSSRYVFNCTYSGLNRLRGAFPGTKTKLKHEIAEMALVQMPPSLKGLGITVMDGPFFSAMPFPARGAHTLSHVRYTPHTQWIDDPGIDPYQKLASYSRQSRADRMLRDAARYMPGLRDARHLESLFEVKTILVKNEGDDGRPILFEAHAELPRCYSVLGGKIDNIYDALQKLDQLGLTTVPLRENVA